jgi:large subunit ribosomal protein L25
MQNEENQMLNKFEIVAELRTAQGKGASRRLRRDGKIPAILYGTDKSPVCVQLEHERTMLQTEHEAFYSHILTMKIGDSEEKVVVKDMQRHPVRKLIMHMDFLRINEAEEFTLRVPLHFVNEAICVGVKQGGGMISHQMSDLEIMCLPKDLPEYIEVDLANLGVGHTIHLADLALPAGVRIASIAHGGDSSLPVVTCHAPRGESESAESAAPAPGKS